MVSQELQGVGIEKLIFGGQALARTDQGVVLVWGALPGEVVDIEVVKKRRGVREAVVTKVREASPDRIQPQDTHYLSCGPWQIMSWEAEQQAKQAVAVEVFRSIAKLEITEPGIIGNPAQQYQYRTKMEFSFADVDGELQLAFFARATHRRIAIDVCQLAHPDITAAASRIVEWLRAASVPADICKSLIVRTDGRRVVAGLFVTDEEWSHGAPSRGDALHGIAVYYSRAESPASVIDRVLAQEGTLELEQTVLETPLRYGLLSFFQVNVPIFEQAVAAIGQHMPTGADAVDLYAGVGAISIPLRERLGRVTLVESDPAATHWTHSNIQHNALTSRYTVDEFAAEKALNAVNNEQPLIVDPPRAGLHAQLTQRIVSVRPPRVVYLSCNVSTQARDIARLQKTHVVRHVQLFNFFPRTPHIESLVVLERR